MNRLVSHNGFYRPVQFLRGENVAAAARLVRAYEQADPATRAAKTRAWMETLLNHLWNVPHFRDALRRSGFSDKATLTAEDLPKIPSLSKQDVRDRTDRLVAPGFRVSWRRTSGSTGLPLVFPKDRNATAFMDAVMFDRYSWYGIAPGDPQARVWGRALGGMRLWRQRVVDYGMNRRRLSTFSVSRDAVDGWVAGLGRHRPRWVYGYPSALVTAVEVASPRARAALRDLPLKAVVCTGEMLHAWQRERLRAAFPAPIVNEYGSTENGVIAFECRHGALHVAEEAITLECDQAGGTDASRPLLVTELHSRSIPFVRYALGDRAGGLRSGCPCRRPGTLLEGLVGREDSFIVLPDGRRVYDAILAYSLAGRVRQYRGRQIDASTIALEVVPLERQESIDLRALEAEVSRRLHDAMRVRISTTDAIEPEPSGKMRYFIPWQGAS